MPIVNNVTRLLKARKIPYQACELPGEKLGALAAAQYLKVAPELVYKTIVVTREKPRKPILAEKKVYIPTEREAELLTGLQAGGISPLALINQGFQVVLDASARTHAEIYISGGQRGLNILLPVEALVKLTNARIGEVSRQIGA